LKEKTLSDQSKASDQIRAANDRLNQTLAKAYDLKSQQEALELEIKALRNFLQGAAVGRNFQQELQAESTPTE
jgi:hypothetical protein